MLTDKFRVPSPILPPYSEVPHLKEGLKYPTVRSRMLHDDHHTHIRPLTKLVRVIRREEELEKEVPCRRFQALTHSAIGPPRSCPHGTEKRIG